MLVRAGIGPVGALVVYFGFVFCFWSYFCGPGLVMGIGYLKAKMSAPPRQGGSKSYPFDFRSTCDEGELITYVLGYGLFGQGGLGALTKES